MATRGNRFGSRLRAALEIPQDIIDEILDHITDDGSRSRPSLLSCSLVSKSWVAPCRRHLFRSIFFTWRYIAIWLETFPAPEESPAHHVRELDFWCGWCFDAPERFFEYIPWFTNVRKVAWSGQAELEPLCSLLSFGRLSQSVTSLAIDMDAVTLLQIRDVVERLPNLNDLSLSGSLVWMEKDRLRGIGTSLRGKFGGRLRLLKGHADLDIVNMLLEVPAGLHFTEVYIHSLYGLLRPTLILAEACGESLVRLIHTVDEHSESPPLFQTHQTIHSKLSSESDCHESYARSFNFAKFPNLEEVKFSIDRTSGGLLWITTALSTLKPTTSPRLSNIQLDFGGLIAWLTDDRRLFKTQVSRVESEFAGVVDLRVKGCPMHQVGSQLHYVFTDS